MGACPDATDGSRRAVFPQKRFGRDLSLSLSLSLSNDFPHPEGGRDPIGKFEETMPDVDDAAREILQRRLRRLDALVRRGAEEAGGVYNVLLRARLRSSMQEMGNVRDRVADAVQYAHQHNVPRSIDDVAEN